jgi:RimJ/RimL family protein N-acetyltransferase
MPNKFYTGEDIYFRPLEPEDAPVLAAWFNDPEIWRTLARNSPMSNLRETEWLQQLYKDDKHLVLGIVLTHEDRLVGCCGLRDISPVNRSAVFGLTIGDRSRQGMGIGTRATRLAVRYAFEQLNLNRVELAVFAEHERAVRAYRNAGFIEEGRARQAYYRNGRYQDVINFAILRSDWEEKQEEEMASDAALASLTI